MTHTYAVHLRLTKAHSTPLHSTPGSLRVEHPHTHTICINLLHLAIFNTTPAPATSHTLAVSEFSIHRQRRPSDRLLFQDNHLIHLKHSH